LAIASKLRQQQFVRRETRASAIPIRSRTIGADTMLGPIKSLISNLIGDAGAQSRSKDNDGRLALLIRVATVHSEMSKVRKKKLHAILKSRFALDDLAIDKLIEDSAEIDRTAIDLYHCTRQLTEVLDDQGRRHVIQMMWEIVCADGKVDALEDNIIWRAADLLGVSSRQRVDDAIIRRCAVLISKN
jgi:uncharacterized tellurite resistance protein B-like protein